MAKILAADIGGTNSRFALFDDSDALVMEDSKWLKSHEADSFSQLLEQLWSSDFQAEPGWFDVAVLAVAGAVRRGVECPKLPNVPWSIDVRTVDFGTPKAHLVNDFAAQAFACRTRAVHDALVLQDGPPEPETVIGVIGAGTGLGYSALIPQNGNWTALASEGGHMAFPFTGEKEALYEAFNRKESGRLWAEGDSVVTGLGLQLVHQFLTGEKLTPKQISDKLTPECETTRWFARFYGRACRDWAVALMCEGGLFISGGVAANNPMFVTVPEFLEEFHTTHVYGHFLRNVPVKVNTNQESGLLGAGFYGRQLLGV